MAGNNDQYVDQGQAKVINLPPIDSFPEPTIRWYEGYDQPVPSESQRYHVTLNHQLVILETRLQSDNNNLYKATAHNGYTGDRSDSQTFVLHVRSESFACILANCNVEKPWFAMMKLLAQFYQRCSLAMTFLSPFSSCVACSENAIP